MSSLRSEPSEDLVQRLLTAQFPNLEGPVVTAVEPGGNDNRTFRVGEELSVRLPSAQAYVAGIEKEHRWLPRLADRLPLQTPVLEGLGIPGEGYPWPWSIHRWMTGSDLTTATEVDGRRAARDLGEFLSELRAVDAHGGPAAGEHSFFRGASLTRYDGETRSALAALSSMLSRETIAAAAQIWDVAVDSEWDAQPVWFHGDLSAGNILADDGRLTAVIDFGTCGVGDPSCDLVIAWTYFEGEQRHVFADAVGLNARTWSRARGWALWKALVRIRENGPTHSEQIRVMTEVLADPVRA
ncbi:MAG: aminoglycoside phosphotransferase family protein [Salinibacterium sp.]|nr:aminoglycoside phosphotransferase family protein [Salinibacterium sp.]